MATLLHVLAFCTLLAAAPLALANPAPAPSTCPNTLKSGGVSTNFYMSVAHVVHSMSVGDLQRFDPAASENNFVPTVNRDLQADRAILPYAPDFKGKDDDMFITEGMKTLDAVLSYSDQKRWDIAQFTPLKLVVHAFHMQEVWARVLSEFRKIGSTDFPKPTSEFCDCAMDLDTNGIMRGLRLIAMATREPGLYYGDESFGDRKVGFVGVPLADTGYHWTEYRSDLDATAKSNTALFPEDHPAIAPSKLISELKSDKATMWDAWKRGGFPNGKKGTNKINEQHRDAALFLHCAIEKARRENHN